MTFTFKKTSKNIEWRHDYQFREDDRQVFRAMIVEEYPDSAPIQFTEFVSWLRNVWQSIPEEWQQSAFIRLGREDSEGYGTDAEFEIYLERLENEEEFAARKREEAKEEEKSAKAQEARERGMLASLKRKYGG
jgi:hypothetical protein